MQGYLYPQNVYRSICLNIVFILVGDGYELRLNVILVEANLHLINKKDANTVDIFRLVALIAVYTFLFLNLKETSFTLPN